MNQVLRSRARAFSPVELREVLSSGLMSFPLTDFDKAGDFHETGYRDRLEWLMPYGATALFAAGGTGEVFSMTPAEQARVIGSRSRPAASDTPIIAGRRLRHAAGHRDGAGRRDGRRGRASCCCRTT